jgi:putative tryptophan/tyrosine transport system substrate-binding protein
MRRRELIALLGGAAAWPLAARAAPPLGKTTTVGVFVPPDFPAVGGLQEGFRQLGYTEGRNLRLEYRWALQAGQFGDLVAELVKIGVDAFVTFGTPSSLACQRATTTIPVVMAAVGDPVGSGLVSSLARPGGNITGFSSVSPELEVKRLQILSDLIPNLRQVGIIWNASNPPVAVAEAAVQSAAKERQIAIESISVSDLNELVMAFDRLRRQRPQAVMILTDTLLQTYSPLIVKFMADNRLPAIYANQDSVRAGGLISYGAYYRELFRRAAGYVDKILHGTKPGELPVQQPERLELTINLKTANALGLTLPPTVLARADEVIE